MMNPLGHSHMENDVVHNHTNDLFILDDFDLPTRKPHKVKCSSLVE
jgi:hypothetical protein